jgi:hypothetical protein
VLWCSGFGGYENVTQGAPNLEHVWFSSVLCMGTSNDALIVASNGISLLDGRGGPFVKNTASKLKDNRHERATRL